jgi:hypothetical protein
MSFPHLATFITSVAMATNNKLTENLTSHAHCIFVPWHVAKRPSDRFSEFIDTVCAIATLKETRLIQAF